MSEDFHMDELPHDECWALLSRAGFGRLAVAPIGEPDIFPVNFLVHEGKVLLRTAPGTKLAEVMVNASVALEADDVHDDRAWSIVVRGTARIVDSFSETYVDDELNLQTWLPSDKPIYVEITPDTVTGRRYQRTSGT